MIVAFEFIWNSECERTSFTFIDIKS